MLEIGCLGAVSFFQDPIGICAVAAVLVVVRCMKAWTKIQGWRGFELLCCLGSFSSCVCVCLCIERIEHICMGYYIAENRDVFVSFRALQPLAL